MSWKINKDVGRFAASNSIHTHSLVTANFTLTDNYVGDFGVIGNIQASGYIRATPTLYLAPTIDSTLANCPYITGVSKTSGSITYAGVIFDTDQTGVNVRIGVNKNTPAATLDILSDIANSLILSTSGNINTNVLASNANGSAISLTVSDTSQSLTLTNAFSTNINATVSHSVSGNLSILVLNKCMIAPQFGVSPNLAFGSVISADISTASFYTVGSIETALYASAEYDSGNVTTVSKCARIIADKSTSIATLDLIAPTSGTILPRGMGFAGGKYCVSDSIARSMGAFGLYSVAGNFVPLQTMVSGTSTVKLRSTLGINTITPQIDNCVLDINGPVIISNAQIKSVYSSSSTTATLFSIPISAQGNVVAAGYTLPSTSGGNTYFTTSSNRGETWTVPTTTATIFNEPAATLALIDIYVYSATTIVACGIGNVVFVASLSTSGTWNWCRINLSGNNSQTIQGATSMAIVDIVSGATTTSAAIFACFNSSSNVSYLSYFTFTRTVDSSVAAIVNNTQKQTLNFSSIISSSNLSAVSNLLISSIGNLKCISNSTFTNTSLDNTYGSTFIFCAGTTGIIIVAISVVNSVVLLTQLSVVSTSGLSAAVAASTSSLFSVFATTGSIISTNDGGLTYITATSAFASAELNAGTIDLSSLIFVDVKTISNTRAVAITNTFKIFYTIDAGITWTQTPDTQLNAGGDLIKVKTDLKTVSTIALTSENADTLFITTLTESTIASIKQYSANIYSGYLPNAVNFKNHTVLKAYGNILVAGDSTITKSLEVGYKANIAGITQITNTTTSTSTTNGALIISGGVGIAGNLNIGGGNTNITSITYITNTEDTAGSTTGALRVLGGVYIAKNLYVSGDFFLNGAVGIQGSFSISSTANISGITRLKSTEASIDVNTGSLIVYGGVGIAGNINVGGSNSNIAGVLHITSGTASTIYTDGALVVSGGVGISGAINTAGNINTSGIVKMTSGTASTVYTDGTLVVSGGVGISGAVNTAGNINTSGIVQMTSGTASSAYTNGTLVVSGGVGISGAVNTNGNINTSGIVQMTSGTASSAYTNGTLVVSGGVGILGVVNTNGNINTTCYINALSINATSDLRYKTDFAQMQYGIDSIMQMQPLTYTFKDFDIGRRHIGLIAQDLAEIIPEAVSTAPDGIMSIAYMELIPILIKAMQQQTDSITALRARVSELERLQWHT